MSDIKYVNCPDIFGLVKREINSKIHKSEIVDEILIMEGNSKKQETIYDNGLLKAIINHPEGKEKIISDLSKSFELVHTIYGKNF